MVFSERATVGAPLVFFREQKMTAGQVVHCGRLGGFKESVLPYGQVQPACTALSSGNFKYRTIANSEESTQIVVEIAGQVLIKN